MKQIITNLNNFDPLIYLEIDTQYISDIEKNQLRTSLNSKIGEYVLLKLSSQLTDRQISEISALADGNQIIQKLKSVIPDVEKRILEEINSFKMEYKAL